MSEDKATTLHKMVNASGFLFQLAVEREVTQTAAKHRGTVLSREHPWVDSETRAEGFIDLVLSSESSERIVIECKRFLDASWIFLVPEGSGKEESRVRVMWSDYVVGRKDLVGWHDFMLLPQSYESAFCVIRGQGEGEKTMLERLAGTLLNSTECLMAEELSIERKQNFDLRTFYYPAIVTTAQLHVCHFDISNIGIEDGKLKDARYESVPFIRFRKSLATSLLPDSMPRNLKEANTERERTILIINASELANILTGWKIQIPAYPSWPWRSAREIEERGLQK